MEGPTPQKRPSKFGLRLKFGAVFLGLLFLAAGILGTSFYFIHTLQGDAQFINYVGQERYRSYKLAFLVNQYTSPGRPETRASIEQEMVKFEKTLHELRDGCKEMGFRGVRPSEGSSSRPETQLYLRLSQHMEYWRDTLKPLILRILETFDPEEQVVMMSRYGKALQDYVNEVDQTVKFYDEFSRGKLYRFRMVEFILIGVVTGVMGGSIFLVTMLVLNPLAKITDATAKLAGGDLGHRVTLTSKDELGVLASSFNTMAEELEALTKTLELRVAERTTELRSYSAELEAFAYSVSHDLRAPLRSIDGFSLAVLEDYSDKLDEQGLDLLQRVRAASQRMGQLIDDMLKLSRVTRSEMRLEKVDLSALALEIATELQKTQPERQVEFIIQPGLTVNGDTQLLQIMLKNLLDNAWKFTSKHPRARVEFGVTQHEGKPAYFVRDDGAGFETTYADKLFAAFQRLHATTEFPGTGIGLATVQRIVHRHGGRIWADGEVEKGATFHFTL